MNFDSFSYHVPTKMVYGRGSLETIDEFLEGRRALLVTTRGFVERGLVDEIRSYTGGVVRVISGIRSHPDFGELECIYKIAAKIDFDVILAVGGGSVIDTAKFISIYGEDCDYSVVEDMAKGGRPEVNYNTHPVIAVPTTAGTGSEVTPFATIWDMNEGKKYSLSLDDLFPELAIYDPDLTLSLPRDITIQTALDTLSHALESIWNKNANHITICHAIASAKLVVDNIVDLSNNLGNIDLRSNMMRACMHAGLAFSNTQTAVAHAISYYVTTHKNIDHGIACSFTLPMLIDNILGEYSFVDEALMEIFGELSSKRLREILKELGVSTEFKDYGLSGEDLEKIKFSLKSSVRANNSLINF